MFSSANVRCMLVAFLVVCPVAELRASSVETGLGLVGTYNIEKIVLA